MPSFATGEVQRCWGASLNACAGGISREHYVSESLFPDQAILVQGLDFCLHSPKELRIESLTNRILCRKHNSALSSLDAAAGKAFEAIRQMVKLKQEREQFPYLSWAHVSLWVDGNKLERWFLKTLINLTFKRDLIIGPGNHPAGTVPDDLVKIAFGQRDFLAGAGLYAAFRPNETFILEDRFKFTAKVRGPNLLMGHFVFRGFRFYLNLMPERFTAIDDSEVFYRSANFAHLIGGKESHRMTFDWSAVGR